uniref:Uncharacterized protein n=1 Tax=Nothoprocta perdicaria TaxID=30464 RepID=A0A8C7A400_NOTPE
MTYYYQNQCEDSCYSPCNYGRSYDCGSPCTYRSYDCGSPCTYRSYDLGNVCSSRCYYPYSSRSTRRYSYGGCYSC